ncbi:MAG: chromosomal replication initiator protein DnaA [Planctomycetota bacterium]
MAIVDQKTFWFKVLEVVNRDLSEGQFETWFSRTECLQVDDKAIVIGVANSFNLEWLERTYRETIRRAASEVMKEACPPLEFRLVEGAANTAVGLGGPANFAPATGNSGPLPQIDAVTSTHHQQHPAPKSTTKASLDGARTNSALDTARIESLKLNPAYTFDNFVVGPSNRLAQAAGLAVVQQAGRVYNPLFIHGGLGLGKTHVLQGICHELIKQRPGIKMLYIPCERFVNHFISSLEKNCISEFRDYYRQVDVLLVDDIHFLAAKDQTQEEFFHTFNALYSEQKQIIISSDSPPKEIPTLEERLVSRFTWGFVCEIEPPTFETRLAIVRKKAQHSGVDVPDDVMEYLASTVRTSIREIEGAVTRLLGYARLMDCPVNMANAKTALGDLGSGKRRVNVDQVIEAVTDHYRVRLSELQSQKRLQSITLPRQVCMYLIRKLTNHSLSEIGGYFGGRDHSTVLYAIDKIQKKVETDPDLALIVDELRRGLTAS